MYTDMILFFFFKENFCLIKRRFLNRTLPLKLTLTLTLKLALKLTLTLILILDFIEA